MVGNQSNSAVTALADGRFVVTWRDTSATGDDPSGRALRTQIFDPRQFEGTAAGDTVTGGNLADTYSGVGGNDSISGFAGDDLVYGGSGNDTVEGGEGGDNLWGGLGADRHVGGDGAGEDFARYDDGVYGNLTIRLDDAALNTGAAAVGDTYFGIEGLVGGTGNDAVVGDAQANRLLGLGGADLVYGGSGNDTVDGGAAGDNLWGGLGADVHIGGDGVGVDFARYDDTTYGNLMIRLDNSALNTGAAAVGDTYVGIEGLVGGTGNDSVYGDATANRLLGQGGVDHVYGGTGNDTVDGGDGGDNLWGGLGADAHFGGDGAEVDFARYDDHDYGNLLIRLDNASLNTGAVAVGDTYVGIEGIVGGVGNDTIYGDALGNDLRGGSGNDTLVGGTGADSLIGGDGTRDLASYWTAATGLRAVLIAPGGNTGDAAGDTYSGSRTWAARSSTTCWAATTAPTSCPAAMATTTWTVCRARIRCMAGPATTG